MDRLPLLRIASTSCLVWAGVSLGTSLAAASKRTSPLLTPPVAVDIQRRISGTSLAVEAALAAAPKVAVAASSSPATERGPSHAFAHKLYVAAEAGKMLSAGMAGFFLIP